MPIELTLINNCPVAITVESCGIDVQLQPSSLSTRAVTLPSGTEMLVKVSSSSGSYSVSVNTGTDLAHEREYDYPVSNMANVYQHIEAGPGGTPAAMTLNFGRAFSATNWMGLLDLSTHPTLADITIPGTHDTGTWNATKASKCQSLDLRNQLEWVIRWFDLRLAETPRGLIKLLISMNRLKHA